jgi:hypothetical protein
MTREEVAASLSAFLAEHPDEVAFVMGDGTFGTREAFEQSAAAAMGLPVIGAPEEGAPERATEVEATPGEMARGILRSAGQLIRGGTVSPEVRAARWETCQGCPFLTPDDRCSKCGCYMKAKVAIAQAECPVGKWGAQ